MTDRMLLDTLERMTTEIRSLRERVRRLEGHESPEHSFDVYTPTYTGATTAGTTTYTTQAGAWVRVGPLVVVYGRMIWTAATGTGPAQIGLPFAARGDITGLRPAATIWISSFTFGGAWAEALLPEGASKCLLYTTTSNAGVTALNVEAAADIAFNISYFVA